MTEILGRLDDPCANVRGLAMECLPHIEVNYSEPTFSEVNCSVLAETVISRLILYFDDPFIKLRPVLIGKLYKNLLFICKLCSFSIVLEHFVAYFYPF